ncbi:MAG: hypothetical protein R3E21_08400 [Caenibius sp.]
MSTLEITLSVALALVCWMLLRLYQKHLILRHLFIHSSDWCARKIDEVANSATKQLVERVMQDDVNDGYQFTISEARDTVPLVIIDAKKEWQKQAAALQARLWRNGIKPLDGRDLDDLIWHPWIAGLKS